MANFEYDIRDLYQRAGFIAGKFPNLNFVRGGEVVEQVQNIGGSFASALSALGTSLFMPLKIEGFQFDGALISINGSKNLVRTTLAGSDGKELGEVTELVGRNPFRIRIRGVVVGASNTYPLGTIRRIAQFCEKAGSLKIENALTSILGIDRMILEEFGFPGVEGVEDAEAFEISGYSEQSLEAGIINLSN
jgi:hypothetical protein